MGRITGLCRIHPGQARDKSTPGSGSPLTLIARVPVPSQREYRAATSDTEIILNIWPAQPPGTSTRPQGAYTIAVTANGSSLVVGNAKSIVTKGLAPELAWLPAANSWAEYFRSGINKLTACFVSP